MIKKAWAIILLLLLGVMLFCPWYWSLAALFAGLCLVCYLLRSQ